jgi:hypothetical protein
MDRWQGQNDVLLVLLLLLLLLLLPTLPLCCRCCHCSSSTGVAVCRCSGGGVTARCCFVFVFVFVFDVFAPCRWAVRQSLRQQRSCRDGNYCQWQGWLIAAVVMGLLPLLLVKTQLQRNGGSGDGGDGGDDGNGGDGSHRHHNRCPCGLQWRSMATAMVLWPLQSTTTSLVDDGGGNVGQHCPLCSGIQCCCHYPAVVVDGNGNRPLAMPPSTAAAQLTTMTTKAVIGKQ